MRNYELFHEGKAFNPDGPGPNPTTKEESDARNAQLAADEVAAFEAKASDRWFAYWHNAPEAPSDAPYYKRAPEIRTWTGCVLATVVWVGKVYTSPTFGGWPGNGQRQNFRAKGIDGRNWAGTYYRSSGDYVRMRVVKSKIK